MQTNFHTFQHKNTKEKRKHLEKIAHQIQNVQAFSNVMLPKTKYRFQSLSVLLRLRPQHQNFHGLIMKIERLQISKKKQKLLNSSLLSCTMKLQFYAVAWDLDFCLQLLSAYLKIKKDIFNVHIIRTDSDDFLLIMQLTTRLYCLPSCLASAVVELMIQ